MASGGRERHSRQLPVPLAHSIAGPWTSYNVSYSRHAKKTLRYVCSRQRVRVECRESGSTSCPARLRQLARSRVYSRIEISGFDNRARGTFVSGITSRIVGRPEVETCEPESMTTIRGACLLAQMVGAFAEFESAVLREHTKLGVATPQAEGSSAEDQSSPDSRSRNSAFLLAAIRAALKVHRLPPGHLSSSREVTIGIQ